METPILSDLPRTFRETERERAFLARLGKDNAPLRVLIMDSNRFPLRSAHASWIPPRWPAAIYEILQGSRAESRLAGLIMAYWGFPNQAAFTFSEPGHRICLMAVETIRRLALFTGTALRWEGFAKILERDRVRDLKAELGEDAYRFAIHSAPLLAGEGFALRNGPLDAEIKGSGESVRAEGLAVLAACLAEAPRALRIRMALKFPRERADTFLSDSPILPQAKAWRLVKRILIEEVDPSWEPLLS